MDTRLPLDPRAAGLMLLLCLTWSLQQISLKAAVDAVDPMLMVALIKVGFVAWVTQLLPHAGAAFTLGAALAIGLVWAVAALSYRFVEKPGIALGRTLARRIAT